jgi:hypothetical protein
MSLSEEVSQSEEKSKGGDGLRPFAALGHRQCGVFAQGFNRY